MGSPPCGSRGEVRCPSPDIKSCNKYRLSTIDPRDPDAGRPQNLPVDRANGRSQREVRTKAASPVSRLIRGEAREMLQAVGQQPMQVVRP